MIITPYCNDVLTWNLSHTQAWYFMEAKRRLPSCPRSLPWCPWNATVESKNFLLGCPLPRRKCLGALALSKTKQSDPESISQRVSPKYLFSRTSPKLGLVIEKDKKYFFVKSTPGPHDNNSTSYNTVHLPHWDCVSRIKIPRITILPSQRSHNVLCSQSQSSLVLLHLNVYSSRQLMSIVQRQEDQRNIIIIQRLEFKIQTDLLYTHTLNYISFRLLLDA